MVWSGGLPGPGFTDEAPFDPVCLALSSTAGGTGWLLASGGKSAELHLSLHSRNFDKRIWEHNVQIKKASINNSVLIFPGEKMRVLVSNNDCTVKFFEVDCNNSPLPAEAAAPDSENSPVKDVDERKQVERDGIRRVYEIKLDCAVNFNPDHTTLLSIADSHQIYIHAVLPFSQPQVLTILNLPQNTIYPSRPSHPFLLETGQHASFAAHFSEDGTKFAVGSQSGTVVVWDVRSEIPIWTFLTEYREDAQSMLLPTRGRCKVAPPYGVRCLKFGRGASKELLAFSERTSRIHVVDTRTFSTHQTLSLPSPPPPPAPPSITTELPSPPPPPPPQSPLINSPTSPSPRPPRPRQRRSSMLVVGSGRPPPPRPTPSPTPEEPEEPSQSSQLQAQQQLQQQLQVIDPMLDIAGLTWSVNGDSLWASSPKSVVEWKLARPGLGGVLLVVGDEDWRMHWR